MIWRVLGIEETKDKAEIKKAYRTQLMSVNPEDKPEEFKQVLSRQNRLEIERARNELSALLDRIEKDI